MSKNLSNALFGSILVIASATMCSLLNHAISLIVRSEIFSLDDRISMRRRFCVGSDDPVHKLKSVSKSVMNANGILHGSNLLMYSSMIAV